MDETIIIYKVVENRYDTVEKESALMIRRQ